ncbi:hypothetical protein GE061_004440 [Apolygus lucorum]|uniref:G-protein coupled receptors family 1 profile domain-containing protein n=1 Tax=Apolygus lucorum TaxID=248454 RepID=A0A8S9WZD8_APOLU|nr:hypothetical protein GE061_004440 [Apolygus lucorum]
MVSQPVSNTVFAKLHSRKHLFTDSETQQAHSNEKAYRTTLLIVGSVIIGFFPASAWFMLVCDADCYIGMPSSPWVRILIAFLNNFLIILKTLINSYIYAARMHEIKNAIRRMRYSIALKCCKLGSQDINGLHSEYSRNHFLSRGSTQRSKKTYVCRLQSIPRHDGRGTADGEYSTPL